ncbi:Ig-like domain-containing protein [Vibrio chaetopteri]|uniref:Ig-like domain-containing protein n=1 Tax=Vibrio chaetopteri TaxID=3016528 RepID=UPI003AB335C0
MSTISLASLVQVSGTLIVDAQGNLTVLPEGTAPRPGDVVIDILDNAEVGEELNIELIQPDGEGQTVNVGDVDAEAIIAQIEQGQDPTQNEEEAPAAGEEGGSSPIAIGSISRAGAQTIAATSFDTSGLQAQGLTETQSLAVLDALGFVPPVVTAVTLVSDELGVGEGTDFDFNVSLSEAPPLAINIIIQLPESLDVDLENISFSEGVTISGGVLNVPAGVVTFNIVIPTVDDDIVEATENYTFVVGGVEASGEIYDNDKPTVLSVVPEGGESGVVEGGNLVFTVTLSEETLTEVQYALNLPESTDVDLTTISFTVGVTLVDGNLNVPIGVTTFDIILPTVDDQLVEPTETYVFDVEGVSSTGTILDNDKPSVQSVEVAGDDDSVVEGENLVFNVTLSEPTLSPVEYPLSLPLSPDVDTADISFTNGVTLVDGMVNVPVGVTTFDIILPTVDDNLVEPTETYTLNLDGVESTGSIVDNDKPSVTSIDVAGDTDSVVEGENLIFSVTLSEETLSPVEYPLTLPDSDDVNTSDISFTNDVTLVDGMLNVPVGVTTFDIILPTVDDQLVEPTETYTLNVDGVESTGSIFDNDKPSVTLIDVAGEDDSVVEGSNLVFSVTLSEQTQSPVQYPLTLPASPDVDTTNISFSNGVTLTDGMLNVPAGITTFNIVVPTVDDELVEPTETYTLSVDGIDSTGTILDNDKPLISSIDVAGGDDSVVEGNDLVFNVTLSEQTLSPVKYPLSLPVSEDVDTSNISFTNGVTLVDGMVNVPIGVTTFDIVLPTVDDDIVEATETYTLSLDSVDATGSILDNDKATVTSVAISDDTVEEGGNLIFNVTLSEQTLSPVEYPLTLPASDDINTAGITFTNDVTLVGGMINVPIGVTTFDIILPTVDDEIVEATEFYDLQVDGVSSTGTILDNDKPTITSIDVSGEDDSVVEGNNLVFSVVLSEETQSAVNYQLDLPLSPDVITSDVSFSNDVTLVDGVLNVPAGVTQFDIVLPTVDDELVEPTETYTLSVDDVQATGSILDNDKPSITSIEVAGDDDSVIEGNDLVFNVTLSEQTLSPVEYPLTLPASPDVDIANISFTNGVTLANGMLTVPVGVTTFDIVLPTEDDTIVEPTETYMLTLDGVESTGTILDNDKPLIESIDVAGDDDSVVEGNDLVFNVTLSEQTLSPVEYPLTLPASPDVDISGISFSNGVTLVDGMLNVPIGVTTFNIVLPTVDDTLVEPTETYTLTIDGVDSTGSILDNDKPSITSIEVAGDDDSVVEGNDLVFNVTLSEQTLSPVEYPLNLPISPDVDTANISFTNDVTLVDGVLNVPVGVTTFDIVLPTVDDALVEPVETYTLTLDGVSATGSIIDNDNTDPIAENDPEGLDRTIGTVGSEKPGWTFDTNDSDDLIDSVTASYDGSDTGYQVYGSDKLGIDGTSTGGPNEQIQYNRNEGKSEKLTIDLKAPAVGGSFSVTNLYADEGGTDNHEQGKWSAYLGDTLIASDYFSNEEGNAGIFNIDTGGFAFDRIEFEAVEFTDGAARGNDSSDYFLQGVSFDGADAYVFARGQEVRIPLSEILANDSDPDGHSFSVTSIFGESLGDAYIDGNDVVFELPDEFIGNAQFQYQITDERGGTDTATVSVLINPAPVAVDTIAFEAENNDVTEGDSFIYNVTLDGTTSVKTFFDIAFGAGSDSASANDIDLSSLDFSDEVTYNAVTGELEIPAGVSSFSIELPTVDDNRFENTEDFTLTIGGQSLAGNILDNDDVTLTLTGGGEVSEDAGSVEYVLGLSNPSDVPFTVTLERIDDTTDSGDFTTTTASYNNGSEDVTLDIINNQIVIPAGVTAVDINVGIVDDDVYEQDEDFSLKVTEPAGLTTNGETGITVGAIISDDGEIDGKPDGDNDNLAPVIDLDYSEAGKGYLATFTEGDDPIMVVDSDIVIDDDIDVITKAEIKLTNPQASDSLQVVGSLPTGLDVTRATIAGALVLTISGEGSTADYEAALKLLQFDNDSEDPISTDRIIEISVFDDQSVQSNVATSNITVVPVNDIPESEDFSFDISGNDPVSVVFDTGTGPIDGVDTGGTDDHISDIEDDLNGQQVKVAITELPLSGKLYHDGVEITQTNVDNGDTFDPTKITFEPSEDAQGFILGTKDIPTGDDPVNDLESTREEFYNWGGEVDGKNRELELANGDIIEISGSGRLTQYRGDVQANHVGHGLGIGGGQGINEGESLTIDFSQRPATTISMGLDGVGGYFSSNQVEAKETAVTITLTLRDDDGNTFEYPLENFQKTAINNQDLFHELSFDVATLADIDGVTNVSNMVIVGVEFGTDGAGNWELRYLETGVDDSFKYKAVDSDGGESQESVVTINDQRENQAPDAVDDPVGYHLVQGDMGDGNQGWNDVQLDAFYPRSDESVVFNGRGLGVEATDVPGGSPEAQIQFNRAEGASEELIITLDEPATSGRFAVNNLIKGEGGGEQGKWSAYYQGELVASDFFSDDSTNSPTFNIDTGGVAFDRLIFEAVEYVDGPVDRPDSSDYFLKGLEVSGSDAFVFGHDEPVVIPLTDILANDSDLDGDSIRITYVFGEDEGDARIEGDNVIFDLPEGFSGLNSFQYQITDDKGGFDTATVNVLVNPAPVSVSSITIDVDSQSVEEGDSFLYSVTLDGSTYAKTLFNIDFSVADTSSDNDIDLAALEFSNGVTYNANLGVLEVPKDVSSFTIEIPTVDDNRYEGDETFGIVIDGQTVTGTIIDNDPVTLSLTGGGEVSEDAVYAEFTLELSNPSDVPLTLQLQRIDGTTDNNDFTTTTASYNNGTEDVDIPIIGGEIVVPSGVTDVEIRVGINDDDQYEQDETFELKVSESAGLTTNGVTGVTAGATISDDGQIGGNPGGDNDNQAPTIDLDGEDFEVVFESQSAGHSNVFGYYLVDGQGNPSDPVVLIQDSKSGIASQTVLAELDSLDNVEFFLIADGADSTPDDATLSFNDQGELLVNGQAPAKPVFLSTDDSEQFNIIDNGNGETEIRIEDIVLGNSDQDFNDLVVTLRPSASSQGDGYQNTFTEGDSPIAIVDEDINIQDDIDTITKAEIKFTNPQANDSLGFNLSGTLPAGLVVVETATLITITGEASSADYEAALKLLEFSNDSQDPSDVSRQIEITVYDDQNLASNVATSTINIVPVNDPPESEDFSFSIDGNDPVSVVFDTGTGTIEGEGSDHISDIEDDADSTQVEVTITELPIGGTLFYNGVAITQTNVDNEETFDPTQITYQPDADAQGFVLGTKVIPTDSDLESTKDEFYNWGDKVDGKNRVLELENGDSIFISSNKGNLTQYRGDVQANHVGHGLGIGGGHGINQGEELTIDFSERPATHIDLGLDGMGGYFYSGLENDNESAVTIQVTLSNGDVVDYVPDVQKETSGNNNLFHELSFSVDDLSGVDEGVFIAGVTVGTDGPGNWELRYIETALNDRFKYKAVDSDEGESQESVVTIVDQRDNNMPPTLDLDLSEEGTGYEALFIEGDAAMSVVDTDITIFDENNVISLAEIVLTNPQEGDSLELVAPSNPNLPANQLVSGITFISETLGSGAIKITLMGDASADDYEAAISLIQFENDSQSPSQDDRIIEITTFDDASEPSNTAVSTISVTGVADVTVAAASGFEDSKIDLDISLPAGSAAESIVISNIPTGAKIFDGNSELTVTDNSVSVTPLMLDTLTVQPPEDSDVDFTLLVTGLDALNQEVEAHDLEVVVKPVTDTPILQVSGDEIVASIDFENVTLNRSWRGDVTETELSSNGSVGTWGTNNPGGIVEVGQEGVYLGGNAQDRDNQLFEIEGRRGKDDSLFTEFDGKGGQFYELNFDVAARRVNDSPLKVFLVDEEDNRTELFEFDDSVNRDWNDVQEFFQVPKDGTYRIEFESEQDDSYGALLDNIVLSARSNVGYEDTYIDISDIVANLTDTDGSESLTLLIQGLPQGAIVTNGTQTSIAGANGKVDISDWSNLDDLQIQVADKGTYPLTITATASEGDTTFSPADKSESELIDLIVLEAPTSVEPNTPPLVTDFEFFAPDDTIPLNFADFVTDAEDDVSNDKDSLVEIVGEPEFGQLYFLSGTGERFDLDVGDLVEDTTNIYYDLEVGFDVSALGYNHQGQDPFGNGVEVTGGTYTGDKPHIGVEMEEIAFDGAGAAKQSGFFTKRDDENGQGKETEAKQNEFMSIRFTAGMMTRALVGVGSLTGQFSAAANGNGAAQIFVYLYAGGTLLDETPIVMDNSTIVDHQAVIEVTSTLPFDEMRIMPYNAEGQDAGFVLQSLTVTDGEVADAFDYRAVDSNGLQSDDTATVNVNIVPNGNVADVEEVDYAVQGGSGVTVIHGTDGDDVLEGGLGNDVLTGGLGNDTFKWGADDLDGSYDVVTDFSQVDGNRDILDLTDVFEGSGETLDDLLDNNNITVTNTADETGTLVNINKDGKSVTIELEGVTGISSLSVPELSQIIIVLDT